MADGTYLTIPGIPIAQPRQRYGLVNGKLMNWTSSRHPANAWKAAVALAWQEHHAGGPLAGPVYLSAAFVFPRPQRLLTRTYRDRTLLHHSRPDCDNLLKAVQDALKGLAWHDDSQVAELRVVKRYCGAGEAPHAELYVASVAEVSNAIV